MFVPLRLTLVFNLSVPYPIMLINGMQIADEVLKLAQENHFSTIEAYLASIDATYEQRVSHRRPEEILSE